MNNPRKIALNALIEYERHGAYTNLLLKKYLRDVKSVRDKKYISALFYGVVENKVLLDYYIATVSSVKLKKINIVVLNILRLGLYQLKFLSTPESAACNTSVELAKNNGQFKSAGFVNAILRKLSRDFEKIALPDDKTLQGLCVRYSVSEKIMRVLVNEFGTDGIANFFEKGKGVEDSIYAAVNLKKVSADELIDIFKAEGISAGKTQFDDLIKISDSVDFETLPSFISGLFHIVGFPSYIAAKAVILKNGYTVFDMCSAPGGKTFILSYNSDNSTKIYAFDIHAHKIKNMEDNCKRLGVTNVFPKVSNSSELNFDLVGKADAILCDVPCSGLGMIFKKPDIKYKDIDFDSIIDVQSKILDTASEYLKYGGRLVYSTCTVNSNENRNLIKNFLLSHPEFKLDDSFDIYGKNYGDIQFLPESEFSDGFYVAVLQKNSRGG